MVRMLRAAEMLPDHTDAEALPVGGAGAVPPCAPACLERRDRSPSSATSHRAGTNRLAREPHDTLGRLGVRGFNSRLPSASIAVRCVFAMVANGSTSSTARRLLDHRRGERRDPAVHQDGRSDDAVLGEVSSSACRRRGGVRGPRARAHVVERREDVNGGGGARVRAGVRREGRRVRFRSPGKPAVPPQPVEILPEPRQPDQAWACSRALRRAERGEVAQTPRVDGERRADSGRHRIRLQRRQRRLPGPAPDPRA